MHVAFDHLAAYGAAAIAAEQGFDTRLAWTDDAEPHIAITGISWQELGQAVQKHAEAHTAEHSWVQACHTIFPEWKAASRGGAAKGDQPVTSAIFSPRILSLNALGIANWYDARSEALDSRRGALTWLDLDMIGALGSPSYWSGEDDRGTQDYGASRWEMKTRNRGEEFVKDRLRKLAMHVAERTEEGVEAGLRGDGVRDEAGKDASDSRTPTGLKPPEPTDNARAWCALWGLSLTSVTHQSKGNSRTAGSLRSRQAESLFLPVMISPWTLARLRTVIRSRALSTVGALPVANPPTDSAALAAWDWLSARGVIVVMRFPVHRSGNKSAPERWAERGHKLLRPGPR
jgi:CRISPR-associated protein Csb3